MWVVEVIDENPPHAILPQGSKNFADQRIAFAGQQALQQRSAARVGGDLFEMQAFMRMG